MLNASMLLLLVCYVIVIVDTYTQLCYVVVLLGVWLQIGWLTV